MPLARASSAEFDPVPFNQVHIAVWDNAAMESFFSSALLSSNIRWD
jgi:hypothetical protein